jgi:hypothetical protein
MLKPRWGRKFGYVIWSAAGLAVLAVLVWLAAGRLDFDDPTVTLKTPVEVVGAKTALTIEAADPSSGLKEVKVTFSQGDQSKWWPAHLSAGRDRGEQWRSRDPGAPGPGFKGARPRSPSRPGPVLAEPVQGHPPLKQEVVIDLVPVSLTFQAEPPAPCGGPEPSATASTRRSRVRGLVGNRFYRSFPTQKRPGNTWSVPGAQEGPAAFRGSGGPRPWATR